MDQMTKQTENVTTKQPEGYVARRIIGALFSLVEIILAFRLIFKLLGANEGNGFVKFIYNITDFFVRLFEGIFDNVTISGSAVFEPATLIALIVVALVAWLVLVLMTPRRTHETDRTVYTGPANPPNNPPNNPPDNPPK